MTTKQEEDVDWCEDCEAIVRDGGQHNKAKHLALPVGSMAYDDVVFESSCRDVEVEARRTV